MKTFLISLSPIYISKSKAMAQVFSLHIFSTFSLMGLNICLHQCAQQGLWYAESCFRRILITISEAEHEPQKWMQLYLVKELVSVKYMGHQPVLTLLLSNYFWYL